MHPVDWAFAARTAEAVTWAGPAGELQGAWAAAEQPRGVRVPGAVRNFATVYCASESS